MDQPQPCTKCSKMPEDILMLACSHDLCLNCAADRLSFEMKKRKPANSIVCQFCYQRTPLDAESVSQLEKLIPKTPATKSFVDNTTAGKADKSRIQAEEKTKDRVYERPPARDYSYNQSNPQMTQSNMVVSGISSKKSCNQHPDEEIMYFCFDCKCECICPECIIHGKHKEHDVKTIRKAHPIVKSELQGSLDKIESSVENLLIRKSEVQKNIRTLNDQTMIAKRQIQSAFEQVRNKLNQQQKQVLSKCDITLSQSIQDLQKTSKGVVKRIEQLKNYSATTSEYLKKQELVTLNFYARKWKEINDEARQTTVSVPPIAPVNNERVLSSILEVTEHVEKISINAERRR